MWYIVGNSVHWQTINNRPICVYLTSNYQQIMWLVVQHAALPRIYLRLNYQSDKLLVARYQIDTDRYIVGSLPTAWSRTTNNLYGWYFSMRIILAFSARDILLVVRHQTQRQTINFMLYCQEFIWCSTKKLINCW
jgi:hypothetical protein